MRNLCDLTLEEINKIFGVVMDTKLQEELMNNNHKDAWMLDFIYDSKLLEDLEKHHQKTLELNNLNNNLSDLEISENFRKKKI